VSEKIKQAQFKFDEYCKKHKIEKPTNREWIAFYNGFIAGLTEGELE